MFASSTAALASLAKLFAALAALLQAVLKLFRAFEDAMSARAAA